MKNETFDRPRCLFNRCDGDADQSYSSYGRSSVGSTSSELESSEVSCSTTGQSDSTIGKDVFIFLKRQRAGDYITEDSSLPTDHISGRRNRFDDSHDSGRDNNHTNTDSNDKIRYENSNHNTANGFDNLKKSNATGTSRYRRTSDEGSCLHCDVFQYERQYFLWRSQYTRSSYCSRCQNGKNEKHYISYWGKPSYENGSWKKRFKAGRSTDIDLTPLIEVLHKIDSMDTSMGRPNMYPQDHLNKIAESRSYNARDTPNKRFNVEGDTAFKTGKATSHTQHDSHLKNGDVNEKDGCSNIPEKEILPENDACLSDGSMQTVYSQNETERFSDSTKDTALTKHSSEKELNDNSDSRLCNPSAINCSFTEKSSDKIKHDKTDCFNLGQQTEKIKATENTVRVNNSDIEKYMNNRCEVSDERTNHNGMIDTCNEEKGNIPLPRKESYQKAVDSRIETLINSTSKQDELVSSLPKDISSLVQDPPNENMKNKPQQQCTSSVKDLIFKIEQTSVPESVRIKSKKYGVDEAGYHRVEIPLGLPSGSNDRSLLKTGKCLKAMHETTETENNNDCKQQSSDSKQFLKTAKKDDIDFDNKATCNDQVKCYIPVVNNNGQKRRLSRSQRDRRSSLHQVKITQEHEDEEFMKIQQKIGSMGKYSKMKTSSQTNADNHTITITKAAWKQFRRYSRCISLDTDTSEETVESRKCSSNTSDGSIDKADDETAVKGIAKKANTIMLEERHISNEAEKDLTTKPQKRVFNENSSGTYDKIRKRYFYERNISKCSSAHKESERDNIDLNQQSVQNGNTNNNININDIGARKRKDTFLRNMTHSPVRDAQVDDNKLLQCKMGFDYSGNNTSKQNSSWNVSDNKDLEDKAVEYEGNCVELVSNDVELNQLNWRARGYRCDFFMSRQSRTGSEILERVKQTRHNRSLKNRSTCRSEDSSRKSSYTMFPVKRSVRSAPISRDGSMKSMENLNMDSPASLNEQRHRRLCDYVRVKPDTSTNLALKAQGTSSESGVDSAELKAALERAAFCSTRLDQRLKKQLQ